MYFVGREKEIGEIKEALEGGNNVIVSGKYGIGRTSLIKHIADAMKDQWRFVFVDFSKTPGSVCNYLLAELFPMHGFDREHRRYRPSRFRIATLALEDHRKHVLVLDNVSKLSAHLGKTIPICLDCGEFFANEWPFSITCLDEPLDPNQASLSQRIRCGPVL
jgi:hypothetical protein